MNSIRNGLRTWIDGQTAVPVSVSATTQNVPLPFLQLDASSNDMSTCDDIQQEQFVLRSYADTAAAAQSTASTLSTSLQAVRSITMTNRVADAVIVQDVSDDVARDETGKELGAFITQVTFVVWHRGV